MTLTQIPARSPAAAPLAPARQSCVRCSAPCSRAVQQQQRLAPRRRRSAPATCSKLSREPPPGFPSGVRTHQNRLLLQSAAEQVVRAEQSKALSRGVAQAGGAAAGPRCCCSYPTRVTTMTRASPVTHRKKVEALRPSGLINCFLQSGFLQLWQILNSQVSQTGY